MDLVNWVTRERFNEYMVAANHDVEAAQELYEWNVAVSAAFFEVISQVEVALRNAVDKALRPLEVPESARLEDSGAWWFANPSFLDEKSELTYFKAAMDHLGGKEKAKLVTRDKVFSSMTFGIWESIFGPSHEQLFRSHLVYAFPNRDRKGFKRGVVHKNVRSLRILRNRIAHHQAIFELPLEERFEQAMDLMRWIDPELEQWIRGLSRVPDLLDGRPAAAESMAVIVPAKEAWPFYEEHGVYICQPGRYFRQISHIGFYCDGAVQREIPKIIERIDRVAWTPEEIYNRFMKGSWRDLRIANIIKAGRDCGWSDGEYQLFFLTRRDQDGRDKGHVTLDSKLQNRRTGRGSAWVHRQRYVSVTALRSAVSLADLDQK